MTRSQFKSSLHKSTVFDIMYRSVLCKLILKSYDQLGRVLYESQRASPADRAKFVPRVAIFAGKAAPGYFLAKRIIELINA
jgi:glucan phosphorylase